MEESNQKPNLDNAVEIIKIGVRLGKGLGEMLRFPVDHREIGNLFEDMSNSKYKSSFEKVLQKIYQTPKSTLDWERAKNVLEVHMKEYGFKVPE